MSALLDLAKPRRIKASHRRRRNCASGHRVYIMNNPLSGTDPTGYDADAMTGTNIPGVDTGVEGGQTSRTITSTVSDGNGGQTTTRVTVTTGSDGAHSYAAATAFVNGKEREATIAPTTPSAVPENGITGKYSVSIADSDGGNGHVPYSTDAENSPFEQSGRAGSDNERAAELNYDVDAARSGLQAGAGAEQFVVEGVAGAPDARMFEAGEEVAAGATGIRDAGEGEGAADLQPYGGPGGGHHVPAKSAFSGAPGYDLNKALAIPNQELARLNVDHILVSGAQRSLYGSFAKTGAPLTWEAVESIETQALVRGRMSLGMARSTVRQAIQALRGAGVSGPTRIPWGGR